MARYYATTNSSNWGIFYDVTEGNYNIENNTSPVYVSVYLYRPYSASYYGGTANISMTVNGSTQSSTAYPSYPTNIGVGEGNAHLMASFSYPVGHDSDGSKYINFSLSWSANFSPSSASGSGGMWLTTIPRASEISSVSTVNIGSSATINVNRKSNSFTHTITYLFGSETGTIVTKSSDVSIPWTIPTSFYQQGQMPNEKTGYGTLTITTYNGDTQIGNSSTKIFYVTTDENACKPIVDGSVAEGNQEIANITGSTSSNVILVAGYSTASVSYTATPRNSASIKTITANNETAYSGTSSSTVTGTKALTNFNADTIDIKATDSRQPSGYSDTKTLSAGTDYTLVPYIPLTFSGTIERQAPTSDTLLLSFSGNYYDGNLGATPNSLTISWKYKEKGASDWVPNGGGTLVEGTDYTIDTTNNIYFSGDGSSQTEIVLANIFDYQTNYEIGIFCNDVLTEVPVVLQGVKGIPIVNWGEDYFNVNGDIRQNGVSILQPSVCKMVTNNTMTIPQSQYIWVDVWTTDYEYGDYECDTLNNRLVITNTSLCQLSGVFAGHGHAWARIYVYEDGVSSPIGEYGTLVQPAGNEYFWQPIQTVDIVLEPTKTYYVKLEVSGYNSTFILNGDFSNNVTWISARKIY